MLSALKNVLWENAEAIIPSYFPWLAPRYSAGPLYRQAPALLLNHGRSEKWPSRGSEWFYSSFAVVPIVSINTCSIDKMQINIIHKPAASVLQTIICGQAGLPGCLCSDQVVCSLAPAPAGHLPVSCHRHLPSCFVLNSEPCRVSWNRGWHIMFPWLVLLFAFYPNKTSLALCHCSP